MFRSAILSLLPTGPIWPRDEGSILYQLSNAWAASFSRNSERAANLLIDAFPTSTTELLTEWESTLGLPDPCAGETPTLSARQAQVAARLGDSGGCSVSYFQSFAKSLGFDITITQFVPARYGQAKFGTPYYGKEWAYVWQVNCPSLPVTTAQYGGARYGDPYRVLGGAGLICEINSRAP